MKIRVVAVMQIGCGEGFRKRWWRELKRKMDGLKQRQGIYEVFILINN